MEQVFDKTAEAYDRWYESAEGAGIFREELACVQLVCPERRGRWLEVGVGTGRFAAALGIGEGVDPSQKMLEYAARRGVRTHPAAAEDLPFPQGAFDGVLMALALCFVEDSEQAFAECFRILRHGGVLLLGVVPADSAWGREYARKAAEGHPIYALARFRTLSEIVTLAERAGFVLSDTAGALFWKPGERPTSAPRVQKGVAGGAGFAALRFDKAEDASEADAACTQATILEHGP